MGGGGVLTPGLASPQLGWQRRVLPLCEGAPQAVAGHVSPERDSEPTWVESESPAAWAGEGAPGGASPGSDWRWVSVPRDWKALTMPLDVGAIEATSAPGWTALGLGLSWTTDSSQLLKTVPSVLAQALHSKAQSERAWGGAQVVAPHLQVLVESVAMFACECHLGVCTRDLASISRLAEGADLQGATRRFVNRCIILTRPACCHTLQYATPP